MAHDPRIMSPAEKIERGMKRLEAERDALRDHADAIGKRCAWVRETGEDEVADSLQEAERDALRRIADEVE